MFADILGIALGQKHVWHSQQLKSYAVLKHHPQGLSAPRVKFSNEIGGLANWLAKGKNLTVREKMQTLWGIWEQIKMDLQLQDTTIITAEHCSSIKNRLQGKVEKGTTTSYRMMFLALLPFWPQIFQLTSVEATRTIALETVLANYYNLSIRDVDAILSQLANPGSAEQQILDNVDLPSQTSSSSLSAPASAPPSRRSNSRGPLVPKIILGIRRDKLKAGATDLSLENFVRDTWERHGDFKRNARATADDYILLKPAPIVPQQLATPQYLFPVPFVEQETERNNDDEIDALETSV